MAFDMARRQGAAPRGPVDSSTIDRGAKRLKFSSPVQKDSVTWTLPGLSRFNDAFGEYTLVTDGLGGWHCTCYEHQGGTRRKIKVCSHASAVAQYTGLPCERILELEPEEQPSTPAALPKETRRGCARIMDLPPRPNMIPGIPERYEAWRQYQDEAVDWAAAQFEGLNQMVAIDAPVGSGKSLLAVAVARLLGLKTLYIVGTKQLQQQVARDFPEAKVIWGRDNYSCIRFPEENFTAADCTHRKENPCKYSESCPYRQAKREALRADLAVVNYSYFLAEANYRGQFSGWPLVICDEADTVEDEILKYVQVTITAEQLRRCGINPPEYKTKPEAWLAWAPRASIQVGEVLGDLEDRLEGILRYGRPPRELMRELGRYKRLAGKLEAMEAFVGDSWIAELDHPDHWDFKPCWGSDFGEKLFWGHCQRILAMSGTLLDGQEWAGEIGYTAEVPFRRVDSCFPKANRPIVWLDAVNPALKTWTPEQADLIVRMVDSLVDKHRGEKGLIHTVSYDLTRLIRSRSHNLDRLVFHEGAADRVEKLQYMIDSDQDLVLVSPSFSRGLDLFGDRARFQILCKLPFASLGDKQTARRRWSGKKGEYWYLLKCVRDIVQMSGRIVRSKDDWGVTYIIDTRWQEFAFRKAVRRNLPLYFREACVW
ncbi:MAG: DEAD/DEAH box helicase family protein [Sphaerochaeta sp.]|jgi:Rad3-related DNA helicase|nr:DEAD/DEAH box helicase family protein [Sphaerochaeta sp.]